MASWFLKLFVKDYQNTADTAVRKRYGLLSSIVGIVVNIILFSAKAFAGILTGSISIIADAANNLSDAGSSIVTLIGFKISSAPPDAEHPFGHGRAEYISGLIIAAIIFAMGIELGKTSIGKIFNPEEIIFDVASLIILICAILFKLWLCYFYRTLGKKINSVPMKASAIDSLSDVVATTAVIFGMVFFLFTGINIDGYVGIVVALFIIYSGVKTAKESLSPLIGQMPDEEKSREIVDTVCGYENIIGVHDLIIHNYGVGVNMISLHAEVPADMDFSKAHELIDIIEDDLKIRYRCIATIHMDPVCVNDEETNRVKELVRSIVEEIDPVLSIHDFRKTNGIYQSNLIFDLVIPWKYRYTEAEIKEIVSKKVHEADSRYFVVINVDRKLNKLD